MYAFLSHESACQALRALGDSAAFAQRWPKEDRKLPRYGDCVTTQRAFGEYTKEIDLMAYGVERTPVDMIVPWASSRSRGKRALFHVWKAPVLAGALLRMEETLYASSPEFVLVQMAMQNSRAEPLYDSATQEYVAADSVIRAIGSNERPVIDHPLEWERKMRLVRMALVASEFAGSYRLGSSTRRIAYELNPLASLADFEGFGIRMGSFYGSRRVKTALSFSFDGSASPRETMLALMLSLSVSYGGYGLRRPELNRKIPTQQHAAMWDGGDQITPDLCWVDRKVVIEYESDEFHRHKGARKATSDAVRANVLSTMGYTVLRATNGSVTSLNELDRLAAQVAELLNWEFADADELTLIRRQKLHSLLMWQ